MRFMKSKALLIVIGSLMATTEAVARDYLLGRTILQEGRNRQAIIPITVCRRADEIQIQAERDTFVTKVIVNFQNGSKQTVQFQRKFDRDERSDWRKFTHTRCISSIQVHGRASDNQAVIKVYGRRD